MHSRTLQDSHTHAKYTHTSSHLNIRYKIIYCYCMLRTLIKILRHLECLLTVIFYLYIEAYRYKKSASNILYNPNLPKTCTYSSACFSYQKYQYVHRSHALIYKGNFSLSRYYALDSWTHWVIPIRGKSGGFRPWHRLPHLLIHTTGLVSLDNSIRLHTSILISLLALRIFAIGSNCCVSVSLCLCREGSKAFTKEA